MVTVFAFVAKLVQVPGPPHCDWDPRPQLLAVRLTMAAETYVLQSSVEESISMTGMPGRLDMRGWG